MSLIFLGQFKSILIFSVVGIEGERKGFVGLVWFLKKLFICSFVWSFKNNVVVVENNFRELGYWSCMLLSLIGNFVTHGICSMY